MKQDPMDDFLTKWPTRSPGYMLKSMLCVLIEKLGDNIEVDPQELLDIQVTESVIAQPLRNGKVALRYSPIQTWVYSTPNTGIPWRNETGQATSSTASIMDDQQLADHEARMKRAADLRKQAQSMQDVEPLTGSLNLGQVKTARSGREPQQ